MHKPQAAVGLCSVVHCQCFCTG